MSNCLPTPALTKALEPVGDCHPPTLWQGGAVFLNLNQGDLSCGLWWLGAMYSSLLNYKVAPAPPWLWAVLAELVTEACSRDNLTASVASQVPSHSRTTS